MVSIFSSKILIFFSISRIFSSEIKILTFFLLVQKITIVLVSITIRRGQWFSYGKHFSN